MMHSHLKTELLKYTGKCFHIAEVILQPILNQFFFLTPAENISKPLIFEISRRCKRKTLA